MKEVIQAIRDVWGGHSDRENNWIEVYWLIKKQLEEIEEKHFSADTYLKEMSDILIIIIRYLDKIGIDPEKLIKHRLETRHRGNTKEIVKKYDEMLRRENGKENE